jgi:hypothetical protein
MLAAMKNPAIFNRVCAVLAALWLLVGVPLTYKLRPPRFHDFGQFYMAAVIARHQAWGDLYPIPDPESRNNPGLAEDSMMRSRYAELAERSGVGDQPRFISPPPTALLLWPLAWLEYRQAAWVWLLVNCVCATGVALLAGRIHSILWGKPSMLAGVVTLAVASSHLMYTTLRALNSEAIIALLLGLSLMLMLQSRPVLNALAMCLATLLKYAGAALLPISFATSRLRAPMWFGVWLAASFVISILIMGAEPWGQYLKLLPLFSRPYDDDANQSVYGLAMRLADGELNALMTITIRVVSLIVLMMICALILRRQPKHYANDPAQLFAAGAALLSWFLIFSPLTWNKYHIYLMPLWGWLAWEARQSRGRLVLAAAAVALSWASLMSHAPVELPEPLTSHMLWAAVIVMGLGLARLRIATAESVK